MTPRGPIATLSCRLQSADRDAYCRPECGFIACLAGFVVGLGERLGKGGRHLSYGNGERQKVGDQATYVGEQRGIVLRSAAAPSGGCTYSSNHLDYGVSIALAR